jgi:hypothetical protein
MQNCVGELYVTYNTKRVAIEILRRFRVFSLRCLSIPAFYYPRFTTPGLHFTYVVTSWDLEDHASLHLYLFLPRQVSFFRALLRGPPLGPPQDQDHSNLV